MGCSGQRAREPASTAAARGRQQLGLAASEAAAPVVDGWCQTTVSSGMSRERISAARPKPPPSASSLPTVARPVGLLLQRRCAAMHAGARKPCRSARRALAGRAPETAAETIAVALVDIDQHHLDQAVTRPMRRAPSANRAHIGRSRLRPRSPRRTPKASTSQLPSWRMAAAHQFLGHVVLHYIARWRRGPPFRHANGAHGGRSGRSFPGDTRAKGSPTNIDPLLSAGPRGAGRRRRRRRAFFRRRRGWRRPPQRRPPSAAWTHSPACRRWKLRAAAQRTRDRTREGRPRCPPAGDRVDELRVAARRRRRAPAERVLAAAAANLRAEIGAALRHWRASTPTSSAQGWTPRAKPARSWRTVSCNSSTRR